jgi:hypothetical protein
MQFFNQLMDVDLCLFVKTLKLRGKYIYHLL